MSMQRATIRYHVTSDEARGGLALIEYTVPPYFLGPARHQHPHMTVAWYVLDGMSAFTLDECTITAPRGTCVLISARHVPHLLQPDSGACHAAALVCAGRAAELLLGAG